MYTRARWHAEGLRWIGSLFLDAAARIERSADDESPWEPLPAPHASSDAWLDEVRGRIQSRYL